MNETSTNPYGLTVEQYFNPKLHPSKDVGRMRQMTSKSQKFSATVALSDSFPLSLHDQVLPVINLMVWKSTINTKKILTAIIAVLIDPNRPVSTPLLMQLCNAHKCKK